MWVSKEEIAEYQNSCLNEINKQQASNNNDNSGLSVKQLPNIDYIYKNKGKEGEVRAFNNNGKGEAYIFREGKWEKLGDVVGGEEDQNKDNKVMMESNSTTNNISNSGNDISVSKNGPKYYPGDKFFPEGHYDFIFDVELQGRTTVLPFNFDGNKLVTSEKFCKRENLHALYKEDIIKFLKVNASVKPNYQNKGDLNFNNYANNILQKVKLPIVSYCFYIFYFLDNIYFI